MPPAQGKSERGSGARTRVGRPVKPGCVSFTAPHSNTGSPKLHNSGAPPHTHLSSDTPTPTWFFWNQTCQNAHPLQSGAPHHLPAHQVPLWASPMSAQRPAREGLRLAYKAYPVGVGVCKSSAGLSLPLRECPILQPV